MPKMKKRVTIEEADNGYTVSSYDNKGEKKMVCKNMSEVADAVGEMMGEKMKPKMTDADRKKMLAKKLHMKE